MQKNMVVSRVERKYTCVKAYKSKLGHLYTRITRSVTVVYEPKQPKPCTL